MIPRSTLHLARARAGREADPSLVAIPQRRPSVGPADSEGGLSFQEWYEPVDPLAAFLRSRGLKPGDRALILAETRMEWFQADLGIVAAGAVTVPAFPNLPAQQLEEIVADAKPTVAFVSRATLLDELMRAPSARRLLHTCIILEERGLAADERVISWAKSVSEGRQAMASREGDLKSIRDQIEPTSTATLIYTSGTSGRMRGVLLTHGSLLESAIASAGQIEVTASDTYLSFLPLSHVLERVVHLSMLWAGARIFYAKGLERLEEEFRRVRPTVIVGVPRLYEKLLLQGEERARALGPRAYAIFRLAERAALKAGKRGPGRRPRGLTGWIWEAIVYRRVRQALGGRVRCAISGGAPLGLREALFLNGAGVPVLEGYGLTETASVVSVNTVREWRLGSVGRPLPGNEIRVEEDGEILVRGPSIMAGYHHDEEGTREVIRDGWLRTGDLGRLDSGGYLFVTGRKKDLIATSQGKKVAPQAIEARLRRSALIREAVVLGDGRPFLTALIFPDLDRLRARVGLGLEEGSDLFQRLQADTIHAVVRTEVDRALRHLPSHELVRDFVLVPELPEVSDGGMTPTLKLRRRELARRYAEPIAGLYRKR